MIVAADEILEEIEGFVMRSISSYDELNWVEVVYWESKEAATNGLDIFLEHEKSKPFLNEIEPDTVDIKYSDISNVFIKSDERKVS